MSQEWTRMGSTTTAGNGVLDLATAAGNGVLDLDLFPPRRTRPSRGLAC